MLSWNHRPRPKRWVKYWAKAMTIKASLGHVRDLPRGQMGVDIENGFMPKYVVPRAKTKLVNELKQAAKDASDDIPGHRP